MDRERIIYLFRKYIDKTASSIEKDEVMQYIHTASDEEMVSLLDEAYPYQGQNTEFFNHIQRERMLHNILQDTRQEGMGEAPVEELRRRTAVWKYVAAALVLVSSTIGLLLYQGWNKSMDTDTAQQALTEDIHPGGNNATLRLANGQVILLNDIGEGDIIEQHGIVVTKTEDGELLYHVQMSEEDVAAFADEIEIAYHTITTPRGGQYQVRLPDGTKVWLNASSSLTYPTLFSKTERRVELTGEGYFEVESNEQSPFIVQTNDQSIRVLGTHFNVNTYQDGAGTTTTLLEGSVMVDYVGTDKKQVSRRLSPGEQSVLYRQQGLKVKKVDVSSAVAWKNGFFHFENTPVEQVLKEFSRWYNFDYEFEGEVPRITLWGSVYRDVNASEALEILNYFNLKYRLVKNDNGDTKWKILVSNL